MNTTEKYLFVAGLLALLLLLFKNFFISRRDKRIEERGLLLSTIREKMDKLRDRQNEFNGEQKRLFGTLEGINLNSQSNEQLKEIEERLNTLLSLHKVDHSYAPGSGGYIPPSRRVSEKLKERVLLGSEAAKQERKLREARLAVAKTGPKKDK